MNVNTILVVLTVIALLCVCLSLAGKWPWSLQGGVILLTVVVLIGLLTGCGTVKLHADDDVKLKRRPGSTCFLLVELDGGDKSVEVTGPNQCVPPPEFCQPGPGETP